MTSLFTYMCEDCLAPVTLSDLEVEALRGADGLPQIRCTACEARAHRPRPAYHYRGRRWELRRDQGCIVSWREPDGSEHVRHEPGHVHEALRELLRHVPSGSQVLSISTPASVLRDVQGPARTAAGSRSIPDPYQAERALLGSLGRADLLPPQARRS